MKELYIIRHAKSSWKDLSLDDFDRPLNKRGKQNAPFMGKILKKQDILPDIIISSPANRARTTAQIITNEINFNKDINFNSNIYEADSETLHTILTSLDDKYNTVFLFGHNPGLNMLVESYIDFYDNIPTCGIIKIKFDCNKWKKISSLNARFVWFDYPKRYK